MLAPVEEISANIDCSIRKLLMEREAIDHKVQVLRDVWSQCEVIKSKIKKAAS